MAAFLLFLAFSILVFGHGLAGRMTTACIGREADPGMFMWYLRWWRYAFDHRVNPFLTGLVWAPPGFNLAWSTFIPLPAWLMIPIGRAFGETAAYNLLCIVAPPLSAASAFMLCRRESAAFWPSILGGYIFGFSPYVLGETLAGHLHLTLAFPIPLAVMTALRRLDGDLTPRAFTIEIAALLVVQFLCGIELFATMTIFGGFSILAAIVFFDTETRARVLGLVGLLAVSYAIAIVLVAPYIYYLFALGFPHDSIWSPDKFTGDLLNLFIPTETNLLGNFEFVRAIANKFSGDIYENGAYLGIPLIAVIEAYRRAAWRTAAGKFLIAMLAITISASFGPALRVAGRALFPMPWALFAKMPIISNALAARFSMFTALVTSLIAALWLSTSSARPAARYSAAVLIVLFLAPNPSALFWSRQLTLPAFFNDRAFQSVLQPREIILPLPFGLRGDCMYWQSHSDMYFRMASGWTGITPFDFARMPIVNFFYGETDLPEPGDQLKAYLARFDVTAIVADQSYERLPAFQPALTSLGIPAERSGDVLVYKIPPGKFAPYTKLSGAEVEARALALRFDTVLAAGSNYLAAGNNPRKLSPLELKRANLLPSDWQINTAQNTLNGFSIGLLPNEKIAIALWGSPEGLKPLLDRYVNQVDEAEYPAPSRWTPQSSPPANQFGTLLMIFNRGQFDAAARQLKASPPLEMTTPFLGADPP